MNKKLLALTSLTFLGFTSLSLSADPLVVFPSGDFSCTAQVTPSGGEPEASPPKPGQHYATTEKQIEMTQVGHIRRNLTTWSDGRVSQFWYLTDQNVGLSQGPSADPNQVFVSSGLSGNYTPFLLRFDSKSVAWITKAHLAGSDDSGLHYKATEVVDPGPPPVTALYQAWIDPKTLVPVKFDDGEYAFTLTFAKEVPTNPLVMPPAIDAQYKKWIAANTAPHH